jgi:hypothetical protein
MLYISFSCVQLIGNGVLLNVLSLFYLDNIDSYCKANPRAIKPHPTNCAQYVDCSAINSPYGKYIQECSYPDLFSVDTMSCQKFESVSCIPKNEPQAPCK